MRTAFVTLLLLAAGAARAAAAAERMGIWVPLYVDPSDEYEKLIRSVETDKCLKDSFHGTVLTGPRSGPPDARVAAENALYRERFSVVANTKQWTAFGYVTTLYGKRALEDVVADVRMWLDPAPSGYGDQVQGIWVDNVKSDFLPEDEAYYRKIVDVIKSYGKMAALNPGINFKNCEFVAATGVDFLNNFENTYEKWLKQGGDSADCPCKDKTRCIASIHSFPPASKGEDLAKTLALMGARGYRAMFVTDRVMPAHYNKLPGFWPEVIDATCQTTIDGKPADTNTPAPADGPAKTPADGAGSGADKKTEEDKAADKSKADADKAAKDAADAKAAADEAEKKKLQAADEAAKKAAEDEAKAKEAAAAAAAETARKAAEQAALDARKAAERADADAKAAAEKAAADAAKAKEAEDAKAKAEKEKADAQEAADKLAAALKAEADAKAKLDAEAKAKAEADAKAKADADAKAKADADAKAKADADAKAKADADAKAKADEAAKKAAEAAAEAAKKAAEKAAEDAKKAAEDAKQNSGRRMLR